MKKKCPYCEREFISDNKQKVYCTPKCSMSNYQEKIGGKRKGRRREANVGYFDWVDFKNDVICPMK